MIHPCSTLTQTLTLLQLVILLFTVIVLTLGHKFTNKQRPTGPRGHHQAHGLLWAMARPGPWQALKVSGVVEVKQVE